MTRRPDVYIDADACPVKDETYKVALRYGLRTIVVSNRRLQIPTHPLISAVQVGDGPDVADDWIADQAQQADIVITQDLPLAERALLAGACALAPDGREHTRDTIGQALAGRALMEHLRSFGEQTKGPAPFTKAMRSAFLQKLDQVIVRLLRSR